MNADKVNFRGQQKGLMRIMDGTTKQGPLKDRGKGAMANPVSELEEQKIRRKKIEATEEDLKKYEEQVFVNHIVSMPNIRNRREFYKDIHYLRTKI